MDEGDFKGLVAELAVSEADFDPTGFLMGVHAAYAVGFVGFG